MPKRTKSKKTVKKKKKKQTSQAKSQNDTTKPESKDLKEAEPVQDECVQRYVQYEPEEYLGIKADVDRLLITDNGEVNIERLICLHFLALRSSVRCQSETNEKKKRLTRYSEILPHYMFENKDLYDCDCFAEKNKKEKNERSWSIHISISKNLENLIYTVIQAIKSVNSDKISRLKLKAHDTSYIKGLLQKSRFQNLMKTMKRSLKQMINKDFRTEQCELRYISFYGVNKDRNFKGNTVFTIELPNLSRIKDMLSIEKDNYFSSIYILCAKLTKDNYLLPYRPGICILQNPEKPSGLALISQDGLFVTVVTGPHLFKDNMNLFKNIAIYVKFQTCLKDYEKEWKIIRETLKKGLLSSKAEMNDEKHGKELEVVTTKEKYEELSKNTEALIKKILSLLSHKQRQKMVHLVKNSSQVDSKLNIKIAYIIKKALPIPTIIDLLSKCTIDEREIAMKSTNYGGFGFARIILGKKTMQTMKQICLNADDRLKITPLSNIYEEPNNNKKRRFNFNFSIPDDLEEIYKEVCEYEELQANKQFIKEYGFEKLKKEIK